VRTPRHPLAPPRKRTLPPKRGGMRPGAYGGCVCEGVRACVRGKGAMGVET
jgi:hypothetical protein